MGGGEEIGSDRLEDWTPKTRGDIWDFHRAAMNRLADIGTSDDEFAGRARSLLGLHIRGLLNAVLFDDVKAMIGRIVAHVGIWPEAISAVNGWLYFDRQNAPKEIAEKVRALFDQLMPTDPVESVVLYTHGWQIDFNNPDVDYDPVDPGTLDFEYSERQARKLADTIARDEKIRDAALHRLVTSDAKTVFGFSRRLAELARDPVALFTEAVQIAETRTEPANKQFFVGPIAGTDQRDPRQARECIRAALGSPKLKDDAISMIASGKLQPEDLQVVVSLLQSGDVEPWQCAALSYGHRLDHLDPQQMMTVAG
jgi:hypothetical protein